LKVPRESDEEHLANARVAIDTGAEIHPALFLHQEHVTSAEVAQALLLGPAGKEAQAWWSGYVATYLDRDLRQLSQVGSLENFHRVMQMLALRVGGLLNESEVARDAGVSAATVGRWLNLLQTGYLAYRLPAHAGNRTTRLMKMPKIHWMDPALGAFLAGHYSGRCRCGLA
jgi:predicted AAA+ superfamily ATPase